MLNCDYMYMCVVNSHFELLEFVFNSVYVDLEYNENSLTFDCSVSCLCGVCSHMVVLGLCVWLSWYPRLCSGGGGCVDCDACAVVCVECEYQERVRGDGGGVVAVSTGREVVHVFHVLCLAHMTCYGRVWCVG